MRLAAVLVAVGVTLPAPARASGFDETTGLVTLEGAALGVGLDAADQLPAGTSLAALSALFIPLAPFAIADLFESSPDAIEGAGYLAFGGRSLAAFLDLRGATSQLRGRRIELRVWQRTRGTRANLALTWYASGVDELLGGRFDAGVELASVALQPTGRLTNDGWQEWTTGPVDFTMAEVNASVLRIFDEQLFALQAGTGDYDAAVRVDLDGLELVDLGEALVPTVPCTLADESNLCSEPGVCLYGRCVDAAAVLGPAFVNDDLRRDYLARRTFEVARFEGGRFPLMQLDLFERTIAPLRDAPVSARAFWTALNLAYQNLADGHSAPPAHALRPYGANAGVCLHLGLADLIAGDPTLPMVFRVASGTPLSGMLNAGDVLTQIDGLSVADWTPLARRYSYFAGDPGARALVTTPEIMEHALRSGSVLRFERCNNPRGCPSGGTQTIVVDLAQLASGVYAGAPPTWLLAGSTCDYRFRSAVPGAGDTNYEYAASRLENGITSLQINGVPQPNEAGGEAWLDTVTAAFEPGPQNVIVDQRLGSGGSIYTVDHLASYLVHTGDFHGMHLYPQLDVEITPTLRAQLLACGRTNGGSSRSCGSFLEWPLGAFSFSNPRSGSAKLAVLLGADVSGNDFLSRLFTFRRRGETRLFGGAPTYGAYGVVWTRPGYLGELSGGAYQVHDSVFLRTADDTSLVFATGLGVRPDENILQTQSDAIAGVDTVLQAARSWVQP